MLHCVFVRCMLLQRNSVRSNDCKTSKILWNMWTCAIYTHQRSMLRVLCTVNIFCEIFKQATDVECSYFCVHGSRAATFGVATRESTAKSHSQIWAIWARLCLIGVFFLRCTKNWTITENRKNSVFHTFFRVDIAIESLLCVFCFILSNYIIFHDCCSLYAVRRTKEDFRGVRSG